MEQEPHLNEMPRESVSVILPNGTVTETPITMISIPEIDIGRENPHTQRQTGQQDYGIENDALSNQQVTYKVVLPAAADNSETYTILPGEIKAEGASYKSIIAGHNDGGSVQIGDDSETMSVQLAVPGHGTENVQVKVPEDRNNHVLGRFQENEKESVQVALPAKEAESVQVALQANENVVLAIDDSGEAQHIVRVDSTTGESQNYPVKTSLQNLVQLLQQGSVQIELPAGLNTDNSVLLSDLISNNEIIQTGEVENPQASTVSNAEYAIAESNVVTVNPQELDGKGNFEIMQGNNSSCKNDTRLNVGRTRHMVSILKPQMTPEISESTVPTIMYALVKEKGAPTSTVQRMSEQERAKQDKINKEIESLSNKKEILNSLLENIKTQMEIFRTEIVNVNISTVQIESYLFLTSKVIYQMLKPLLELAAEVKQFADQGQFSWKQDSYCQTDRSSFAAKNAWTQTPSVSSVSGREIRQPSRFHVNQDSDSENEGRRQSKRKRKHTLRYLRSSKSANLQRKIAYVPAVDIKVEKYTEDEVDPPLNQSEEMLHSGVDPTPNQGEVMVPDGVDPRQNQGGSLDVHTEAVQSSVSVSQGNQCLSSTDCIKDVCTDEEPRADNSISETEVTVLKADDTNKVSLADPNMEYGEGEVIQPALPSSMPPESQQVLPTEAESDVDSGTGEVDAAILQDHKQVNNANIVIQDSLQGSEAKDPASKAKGSKGRKKTWRDYESLLQFKFFCSMCSFKTKRQSHYLKHLKYHDKQPKLYHCKLCDFKTIRNGELRKHEVNHSGNVIACSLCKYVTDDQIAMNRHKRLKHGDKHFVRDHFVCLICKFKSVTLKKLEKHMQQHKSPEDDHVSLSMQYSCDICPYKTKRKEHLIRHKNVHSDLRPYLCDTCGQKFKRTDALSQHKLVHVEKQNRKYGFTCSKCNKGFRSQSHLQEHMAIHSTEKHFLCDICGSAFKTKSSQQKHIKNLHQSPRSFSCQTCDKKFNTNYALKRHERTHELLPYQKANNNSNVLVGQEFLNQNEVAVTPQDLVQVQDIIAPGIEETYDAAADKLQQAFSSLNNENSTAIMYLSSSLPASWT